MHRQQADRRARRSTGARLGSRSFAAEHAHRRVVAMDLGRLQHIPSHRLGQWREQACRLRQPVAASSARGAHHRRHGSGFAGTDGMVVPPLRRRWMRANLNRTREHGLPTTAFGRFVASAARPAAVSILRRATRRSSCRSTRWSACLGPVPQCQSCATTSRPEVTQ